MAARLFDGARDSGAARWLFAQRPFEQVVDAWLDEHGDWALSVNAAHATERAIRDTIADAMVTTLFALDLDQRVARHRKRAPFDLAREGVERAQLHGLDLAVGFREPTEEFQAAPGGDLPMPFDSDLLGWLYWHERHEITRLLARRSREAGGVVIGGGHDNVSTSAGRNTRQIDPPTLTTGEDDALAAVAGDELRSLWTDVRHLLLNPGELESRLWSADLRADASALDRASSLAVAAGLAEVLTAVLDTGDRVEDPSRWWSDLDVHCVEACRLVMPAKAESEGWRSRVRANVGHALGSAMTFCASTRAHHDLAAAIRVWTAVHLKNFVQKGPADDKPLIRVEARIDWWQRAVDELRRSPATATTGNAALAADVLSETASWLQTKGIPRAASRWADLENAALEALRAGRGDDVDTALDHLLRWHQELQQALAPPPLATFELAAAGVPVPRRVVHQTSEAVLVAFIEVGDGLLAHWPPAEQVTS